MIKSWYMTPPQPRNLYAFAPLICSVSNRIQAWVEEQSPFKWLVFWPNGVILSLFRSVAVGVSRVYNREIRSQTNYKQLRIGFCVQRVISENTPHQLYFWHFCPHENPMVDYRTPWHNVPNKICCSAAWNNRPVTAKFSSVYCGVQKPGAYLWSR